jgi:hypothetical protein
VYDPNYSIDDPTGPRKSRFWSLRHDARCAPQPWQLPLRKLVDREPIVLAEHGGEKRSIDLGYERRTYDAELFVPVYAAQDGVVMFCGESRNGFAVSITHEGQRWATCYRHLSKVFLGINLYEKRKRRQRVRGGEIIGYAATSPIHVRFEMHEWTDERGFVAVDPIEQLASWIGPLVTNEPASKKAA